MSPSALPLHLSPESSRITDNPKSLTPQRKHRKLLKDGSGTEVWPESIEKVFVQGLREYWDSPYATYSQSRGRSRWRNQFLVEYLQRMGITRSKKQVASHIQVLRNMWKGEPQFHLVAGGEEATLEPNSPSAVKVEEDWDSRHLIPFDYDDDATSSNSASPDFSPPDHQADFPQTPEHFPSLHTADLTAYQWPTKPQSSPSSASMSFASPVTGLDVASYPMTSPQVVSYSPLDHPSNRSFSSNYGSMSVPRAHTTQVHQSSSSSFSPRSPNLPYNYYPFPPNRVTALCLTADGMSPFSVKLDGLGASAMTPLTLRVNLSVTTVNDFRSPSTLHGFAGNICLASVWKVSGKCLTRVFVNNACISEDTGYLDVSHINVGTVNAFLPESSLTRCRWLDASIHTFITQEIVVDDTTLLYVIYELDRRCANPLPSAQLVSYKKYSPSDKTPVPYQPYNTPQPLASARRTGQTSLSSALTPVRFS